MMRIDAHQHFWSTARRDYGWLSPDDAHLYRDFGPGDLRPLMDGAGIDATILVQAAPTEAETAYLLDIADRHDWIGGVVGWTDLASPHALRRIAALADRPKLVGVRPMLQDMLDPAWINRPPARPGLHALATYGLVLDALVRPHQIYGITAVARAFPSLTIVIDHGAKPAIGADDPAQWLSDMRAAAAHPNVHVKLSGLLTEAPPGAGAEALRPYVEPLLEAFGTERMLWGSDWPVLTLAADYAHWCSITGELLAGLDPQSRSAILGGNAARIYRPALAGLARYQDGVTE